jgi:hypothetical protein
MVQQRDFPIVLTGLGNVAALNSGTARSMVLEPFGFEIYGAVLREPTAPQLEVMGGMAARPDKLECAIADRLARQLGRRSSLVLVMMIAVAIAVIAVWRKQFGAGILLLGAAIAAVQRIRSQALLAIVTVIAASSVLLAQFERLALLPPDAPEWQRVAIHYDINVVLGVRGPLGFRLPEFYASS